MKTAFFIDAEFFLRRLRRIRGDLTAKEAVEALFELCIRHLLEQDRCPINSEKVVLPQLYRIFVYDCPPLGKKVHWPVSKKAYDLGKTPTYLFRTTFQKELRTARKVALRLGSLSDKRLPWILRPGPMKDLLNGKRLFADLTDDDFEIGVEQKGVDMRIGLDIASIASKRFVDQIILVAGDTDFIPAAKAARREGIDFILDSMNAPIPAELHEHVDWLHCVMKNDPGQPFDGGGNEQE